jgi:hypothetical protein
VLNLGNPRGKGHVLEGLGYVWTPDFSAIKDAGVWMAAAGQIFFTLSIGTGSLITYSSYLKEKDDVVLTGLTTASTNELVEVILGGSLAIPATAAFYGPASIKLIAEKGTFNLGFVAMPEILRGLGAVEILGAMWFLLLFFAALTSSVALTAPVRAFFIDELRLSRANSTLLLGIFWLLGSLPVIIFFKYGFLDEIDFWVGTLGLVVFASVEAIIFIWIYGAKRAWQEMHVGCDIKIPKIFYPIMLVITPLYLLVLLGWWTYDGIQKGKFQPKPSFSFYIKDKLIAKKIEKLKRLDPQKKDLDIKEIIQSLSQHPEVWQDGDDQEADLLVTIDDSGRVKKVSPKKENPFTRLIKTHMSGWSFKAKEGELKTMSFLLYVRGLNCPPYLWGARALIIGLFVIFSIFTFFIWRARARSPR